MHVLSYFTTDDEALHVATSPDGHHFTPLDDGAPVLRGQVGAGTLRDPFLLLGPDGLYHLLATDGWSSPRIVHATSPDLRRWSPQRLLEPMAGVTGARNAWAPEAFTDDDGVVHLLWSSVIDPDNDDHDWHHTNQEHRIWHTATRDFTEFTEPRVFFDPGYPVIDATVARADGRYVMAFKDERGENTPGTDHKNILLTTFTDPHGPLTEPTGPVTPSPVEGPSLFRRGDEWVLIFDHFLDDGYGALASADDMSTWEPTDIGMPPGMRHASVLVVP